MVLNNISIIIIAQDNSIELSQTLNSIHENVQVLQKLGFAKSFKGIVVVDYASHPTDADEISQLISKEKSAAWTEFVFERRIIPLTPTFAFERGLQLQSKLEKDFSEKKSKDWVLFLKPGMILEATFLRRFLINPPQEENLKPSKKNPLGLRVAGEFVVPQEENPQSVGQRVGKQARGFFQKYSLKQLFGVPLRSEIFLMLKSDVQFLSLDWYARYPKFTMQDVIRDALKGRGWKKIYRPDLVYRKFVGVDFADKTLAQAVKTT